MLTVRESFGFHWREFMRRTISVSVCVLTACFCAGVNAQIPENAMFQPGSYAVPYYRPAPQNFYVQPAAVNEDADDSQTDWEKEFNPQTFAPVPPPPAPVQTYEVPHLTFVYNHWTRRFHIAPYEPGYAAQPSAFPTQTSPLHVWVSSKSSAAQPRQQVPYMSYYDPDPVILPAEIRLRGTKMLAPLTQLQPMPMPMPRPETARVVAPSARTRIGERMRQTFGTFIVE